MNFKSLFKRCRNKICCGVEDAAHDVLVPIAGAIAPYVPDHVEATICFCFSWNGMPYNVISEGDFAGLYNTVEHLVGHSDFEIVGPRGLSILEDEWIFTDACVPVEIVEHKDYTIECVVKTPVGSFVVQCEWDFEALYAEVDRRIVGDYYITSTSGKILRPSLEVRHLGGMKRIYAEVHLTLSGGFWSSAMGQPKNVNWDSVMNASYPFIALRKLLMHLQKDGLHIADVIEDVLIAAYQIYKSKSRADVMLAAAIFIKSRSKKSICEHALTLSERFVTGIMLSMDTQANDGDFDALKQINDFRDLIGKWEELSQTTIAKKLMVVIKYLIAFGCFEKIGIKHNANNQKKMEELAVSPFNVGGLIYSVVDFASFAIQRGLMYHRTGEWSVFLHGPKTYAEWFDRCMEVKRHAASVGNLDAQGTTYFKFVNDIKRCIEEGKAIVKFSSRDNSPEFRAARHLLNEIMIIEANVLTQKSAQQERRAPFGVLVYGHSSVAKSMFCKMLFYYYGKVLNLPQGDEYKYTRNSADQYWSGFSSDKWCIQLDDVAYLSSAKAMEDPSLTELIALVNNVPLVPNQAALEDKGRTPVRAKFVIATSNTKDMNAPAYFQCPLAVQRRLPWVITVRPKPEYERKDAPGMIDPTKMEPLDGGWPDYWIISIDKVVPGGKIGGDRDGAKHENIKTFSDVNLFLDWFKEVVFEFEAIQAKAMRGDEDMKNIDLCLACNRVKKNCECLTLQAGTKVVLPSHLEWGDTFIISDEDDLETQFHSKYEFVQTQYYCTTVVMRQGKVVRKYTCPADVVTEATLRRDAVADKDIADVLEAVLEAQRTRNAESNTWTAYVASKLLVWYFKSPALRTMCALAARVPLVAPFVSALVMSNLTHTSYSRAVWVLMGEYVESLFMNRHWKRVVLLLSVLMVSCTAYAMYHRATQSTDIEDSEEETEEVPKLTVDLDAQVKTSWHQHAVLEPKFELRKATPEETFRKTEKENIWKKEDYCVNSFDLTPVMRNYATLPREQFFDLIRRNCARLDVRVDNHVRKANAFCVGGRLWMTNNHIFRTDTLKFKISLRIDAESGGLNRNVTFVVEEAEVFRMPQYDVAWFIAGPMDVRKDLTSLFTTREYNVCSRGAYIGLNDDASPKEVGIRNMVPIRQLYAPLGYEFDYYAGRVAVDTNDGDCGSVAVHHEPSACILGIHQLGGRMNQAYSVRVTKDMVEEAKAHFGVQLLQSGEVKISAPSAEKTLGPLHHKSSTRWVESGTAAVFGSFAGFKPKPRSRVKPTLLGKEIQEERGWEIPFGAPDLKDWRPWRHALLDTTAQTHLFTESEILSVANEYVEQVSAELDFETLAENQPLSLHAAVNGIDGVQFIDKMNFNTSMGEPYCKSKKHFVRGTEDGKKEFVPEVMEEIARIEACYAAGVRANPVFSGQLKDEARALKKIADGKIRVFTGAPAAWSVVMRKYCLPFVRMMQMNPLAFESAPGCVVQSLEWEKYHEYLTQFGKDRMIAGDYGKFDKKMSPMLIRGAFHILAKFARKAGWSESEVQVFYLLAEDCAYPYVNFNGDLLMFFGSNPSGQALTVVVNCLVNCMYMRLMYRKLNPANESLSFKKNVALLTYGDDNEMGVSRGCDWFNHTAISEKLAEYGVEYTMADKESKSRPFINIEETSFLKRGWRWDEDVGAILAPLEIDSIRKMLCIRVATSDVGETFHMASVICAANNEWFFHGKEVFEREHAWLQTLIDRHELHDEVSICRFETWDSLVDRFWRASKGVFTKRLGVCDGTRGESPK